MARGMRGEANPGGEGEPGPPQVARDRRRPRGGIELQGTARGLADLHADAHEIDAAQLIEDQVRQEAEHDADGEVVAQPTGGRIVAEEDDQAGDAYGREAVEHAA